MRPDYLMCLSLASYLLVACGSGSAASGPVSGAQPPATAVEVPAQGELVVHYAHELSVSGQPLTHETTSDELIQRVGQPSRTVANRGDEVSYFYDDAGMVFFVSDGRVGGVGFNFNWDGDERFPSKAFTGTLSLGERAVSIDTTREDVDAIQEVGFTCPAPVICASEDRNARVKVTVGFKDGKLTQVFFIL